MNKVMLMGRLTKSPEVKYLQNENHTVMARYMLAIDRRYGKETDFISCVTFGKNAEKYLHKGLKIAVSGRIQTGSYSDSDGKKIYTMNVLVEEHYFAEGRKLPEADRKEETNTEEFMEVPEGEELPFD